MANANTLEDFLQFLEEVTNFMKSLNEVLPEKVDTDLITFLESVSSNQWASNLLFNSFSLKKTGKVK